MCQLKDHLQTKGRIFFSKFEDAGCTATKRNVFLGRGIEIRVMHEPPWGRKSWKHAKFPAQFSGEFNPVQPPPPRRCTSLSVGDHFERCMLGYLSPPPPVNLLAVPVM